MKKYIPLLKGIPKKQSGINMVDLMMWLVIAALLLAAAIQGIGYYQQNAYVYQMKSAVDVAASRIMALSANDGSVDPEDADLVVAETNAATPNDGITLTVETIALTAAPEPSEDYGFQLASVATATTVSSGQTFYLKATNPAVKSSDVAYFFKDTATNKTGVGLLKKDQSSNGPGSGSAAPSFNTLTWTKKTSTGAGFWNSARTASTTADASTILVGNGNQGYLYLSKDSGASWARVTGAPSGSWTATAMTPSGNVMIASRDMSPYGIYKSTDGGTTWNLLSGTTTQVWDGLTISDDGTKMAAIDKNMNGAVWTSVDSGATWVKRSMGGAGTWTDIDSSADGTKLVGVKYGGHILTSVDSGATWTQRTTTARYYNSVGISDDGTKIITADYNNGYIYTSSDSGATWSPHAGPGVASWNAVTSSADGTKLAVTRSGGTIVVSKDAGATWTVQTDAGSLGWAGIVSSADGTKLIAAPSSFGYVWSGIWS